MAIQTFKARVSEKKQLAKDYYYLHLELVKPNRLEFKAGQYLMLKVPGEVKPRHYSIASAPGMNHAVELLVNTAPQGKGSKYILDLKPGDKIEFKAPVGVFGVSISRDAGEEELVFVATGSGITPFRSMILDLLISKKDKRLIWLHWGMRNLESVFWFDDFAHLAQEYDNFTFDFVLSKPPEEWKLCKGYVTECMMNHHKDFSKMGIYLCGGKPMIEDMQKLLSSKGVLSEKIHKEQFYE